MCVCVCVKHKGITGEHEFYLFRDVSELESGGTKIVIEITTVDAASLGLHLPFRECGQQD